MDLGILRNKSINFDLGALIILQYWVGKYFEDLWSASEDKVEVDSKLLLEILNSNFINDGGKIVEGLRSHSKVSWMATVQLSKSKISNLIQLSLQ